MQWLLWLIAIIVSLAGGYWVYNADKRRVVPYPWLTALLRSLVIFLTILLLLIPVISITRNKIEKPVILMLQDNSSSIANALGKDSTAYRQNVQKLTGKLADKYHVVKWGFGGTVRTDSLFRYDQRTTDIASVLARAEDFYGIQNLGAVVLATDGRYNQGANPLYQQLSLHSPLYTVAIGDSAEQKDLKISRTYANKTVSLNSDFEIRADIIARLCNGYGNDVVLQEGGKVLGKSHLSVNADRYDRSVSFMVKADHPGLHHYVLSVPAADGEKNTTNNRRDVFVDAIDEKKNILILTAAPHPDVNAISEALSGLETYKITVRTADHIPTSFDKYQVVILNQIPSATVGVPPQLKAAKNPLWFILGSESNIAMLNEVQQFVHFVPAPPHDILAGYNNGFTTFILPQNTQAVMDKMPPLVSPVAQADVSPAANVLFEQRQGSVSPQQPVWVLQQGTEPMAMLMGEDIWRWRLYEYKDFNEHNVIDECIRQTITFLTANSIEHPFKVDMPKYVWSDQEAITLNAYLLNANNEQVNTPDAKISITDSAGQAQDFSLERSGNAYHLNIGVHAGGTYTYHATTTYDGKKLTANGSFIVQSIPLEQMETGANYPLLYSLARKYNGTLIPASNVGSLYDTIAHNQNIKPVIHTEDESVPLVDWKWYFFLILLLATAEWLLRKYWLAQ